MITFFVGLFIGCFLGIILIALMSSARDADDRAKRLAKAVKEMEEER